MRVLPILFNTPMVQAVLAGTKTQTRRAITAPTLYTNRAPDRIEMMNVQKDDPDYGTFIFRWYGPDVVGGFELKPKYLPGDVLYVRETWNVNNLREEGAKVEAGFIYKAADAPDYDFRWVETTPEAYEKYEDGMSLYFDKWRPSIHMPKEAARLWLRVTDVRAERLLEITEADAEKEGLYRGWCSLPEASPALSARQAFHWLWDSIIKPADKVRFGWTADPWVWVIEFERISKEEV
ncbi:MAG: hypothetical protein J6P46_08530 [Bacteroidales bacterium]|nr:hypothetical protein [Bacteroidales bacterium]